MMKYEIYEDDNKLEGKIVRLKLVYIWSCGMVKLVCVGRNGYSKVGGELIEFRDGKRPRLIESVATNIGFDLDTKKRILLEL